MDIGIPSAYQYGTTGRKQDIRGIWKHAVTEGKPQGEADTKKRSHARI